MGGDGEAHTFPSPTRYHLSWLEFQLLSGLMQTKTFGLSQIQDLQPMSSSQVAGVLGRHLLGQQELSGAPGEGDGQDELERGKPQARGKCCQSKV